MFLRNCWYVIAWEHEFEDGGLLERRMITAQCRNLVADAEQHMQVPWMDAALVQFRRVRERMIRDESAG